VPKTRCLALHKVDVAPQNDLRRLCCRQLDDVVGTKKADRCYCASAKKTTQGKSLKSHKRLVKYYDLKVGAHSRDREHGSITLPARPVEDVLVKMQAHLAANVCERRNRSKTETWNIADIQFALDRTSVCLLVNRSDKMGADQAISDPATRHFAVAAKQNDQGNAFSAHVVIKLHSIANSTYLTLIEEASGVSSADIAMLLKLVTKAVARADREFFMCNDASGDVALRRFTEYSYEFRAHPSREFEHELNSGKLSGIELVEIFDLPTEFDGVPGTLEKKKVTHLTMEDAPVPLFDRIKALGRAAVQHNVGHLRVIFQDTGSFRRTVDLDAATMNLVNEDRFVRKAKIEGFGQKLNTGYENVNPEIFEKMRNLL
jgi:hypothetical protein